MIVKTRYKQFRGIGKSSWSCVFLWLTSSFLTILATCATQTEVNAAELVLQSHSPVAGCHHLNLCFPKITALFSTLDLDLQVSPNQNCRGTRSSTQSCKGRTAQNAVMVSLPTTQLHSASCSAHLHSLSWIQGKQPHLAMSWFQKWSGSPEEQTN